MLDAFVTDLDAVDEAHRGLYHAEAKDGKFFLNVTAKDGYAIENATSLKSALGAERASVARLNGELKVFEGLDAKQAKEAATLLAQYGDLTPAQAKALSARVAEFEKIDPKAEAGRLAEAQVAAAVRAATDALNAEFGTKAGEYQSAVTAAEAANAALTGQLKALLVDNAVKAQLAELRPIDNEAVELIAARSIRTVAKDGNFLVEVLDAAGNPRIKVDQGNVVPFTVADLLAEIKTQKPGLFQADKIAGTGITPSQSAAHASPGQGNPWAKGHENRTQQAILKNTNPTKAAQLMREAGVA